MTSTADLLQNSSLVWLMASGLLLGALHALEPGHAKTMIASFVVTTRGTVPQAILLGLSAAVSHSALVWVLALGGLYFGNSFIGDDAEPWLQLGSGLIIVVIGLTMLTRQFRGGEAAFVRRKNGPNGGQLVDTGHGFVEITVFEAGVPPHFRLFFYDQTLLSALPPLPDSLLLETTRPDGTHQKFQFKMNENFLASTEDIPEPHEFSLTLSLLDGDHAQEFALTFVEDHDHGEGHHHHEPGGTDRHAEAHARQMRQQLSGRAVSTRQIIGFGLSSGLIPCPAALTMLLVCLRLKKIALGIGLVAAFSMGLAVTLVALGVIAAVGVAHASRRLSSFGDAMPVLPYLSSALVVGIGVYMGLSGFTHLT